MMIGILICLAIGSVIVAIDGRTYGYPSTSCVVSFLVFVGSLGGLGGALVQHFIVAAS